MSEGIRNVVPSSPLRPVRTGAPGRRGSSEGQSFEDELEKHGAEPAASSADEPEPVPHLTPHPTLDDEPGAFLDVVG